MKEENNINTDEQYIEIKTTEEFDDNLKDNSEEKTEVVPAEKDENKVIDTNVKIQPAYDSWASQINGIPLNVHLYYINMALAGKHGKNFKPFSKSGQVINFLFMPFLDQSDVDKIMLSIDFDQGHYGTTADEGTANEVPAPKVYKLYGTPSIKPKVVGSFSRYPSFQRVSTKSWTNESKIYQYPYHFVTINDYINTPLLVKNNMIPDRYSKQVDVYVYQPITMTGGYTVYIPQYKGDSTRGANEGMFANAGLDLPTSSSEYAQFMATSKAQFQAMQNSLERNAWTSFMGGLTQTVTGLGLAGASLASIPASGGISTAGALGGVVTGFGMATQGVTSMIGSNVENKNRIEQAHAKINDMLNAPRNVSMPSSDALMSLTRNMGQISANRYMVDEYYRNKLADFWHMYGYKQNKLMLPDLRSRKYFNYVKTYDANIEGFNMDKIELDAIKQIFNNGVRFWHQKNGPMHQYCYDNVEV